VAHVLGDDAEGFELLPAAFEVLDALDRIIRSIATLMARS
jgi:hypothetical protein